MKLESMYNIQLDNCSETKLYYFMLEKLYISLSLAMIEFHYIDPEIKQILIQINVT